MSAASSQYTTNTPRTPCSRPSSHGLAADATRIPSFLIKVHQRHATEENTQYISHVGCSKEACYVSATRRHAAPAHFHIKGSTRSPTPYCLLPPLQATWTTNTTLFSLVFSRGPRGRTGAGNLCRKGIVLQVGLAGSRSLYAPLLVPHPHRVCFQVGCPSSMLPAETPRLSGAL